MAYVEWLRVRNVLRVLSIVLGSMILLAAILRVTPGLNPLENEINAVSASPTAHVRVSNVSGGTQTVIDDPEGNVHAVIVDYGFGRKSYSIGPIKRGESYSIDAKGAHSQVHITGTSQEDMSGPADVNAFVIVAIIGGMIVAFFLGGSLGRENEQVALAWTKPIGRTELALRMFGVDAIGIVTGMLLNVVAAMIAVFIFTPLSFTGQLDWSLVGIAFAAPFCWHAFVTAATTSLKRYSRAVGFFGVLYAAAVIVPGLARAGFGDTAPGAAAHAIFSFLGFFDPITYLHLNDDASIASRVYSIEILLTLTVAYVIASLVQWRRLEA